MDATTKITAWMEDIILNKHIILSPLAWLIAEADFETTAFLSQVQSEVMRPLDQSIL